MYDVRVECGLGRTAQTPNSQRQPTRIAEKHGCCRECCDQREIYQTCQCLIRQAEYCIGSLLENDDAGLHSAGPYRLRHGDDGATVTAASEPACRLRAIQGLGDIVLLLTAGGMWFCKGCLLAWLKQHAVGHAHPARRVIVRLPVRRRQRSISGLGQPPSYPVNNDEAQAGLGIIGDHTLQER